MGVSGSAGTQIWSPPELRPPRSTPQLTRTLMWHSSRWQLPREPRVHPRWYHLGKENIQGFNISFGFASVGFCTATGTAGSKGSPGNFMHLAGEMHVVHSAWRYPGPDGTRCMPYAWLLMVIRDWEDTSLATGKPVPSLGQGRGYRICSTGLPVCSSPRIPDGQLPGSWWGRISHPRWHRWDQTRGSWGAWPSPCLVYPVTDVSGPGTALGEAAAGARPPMSTRHGCGVTATSRLLKCRCSAMVDVINNAISDLFFPV